MPEHMTPLLAMLKRWQVTEAGWLTRRSILDVDASLDEEVRLAGW